MIQEIPTDLLHNASLPLGKGGVPPQLVVDELHFDLHLVNVGYWHLTRAYFDIKADKYPKCQSELQAKEKLLPHPSFCLLAVVGSGGAIGFASPSTRWVRSGKFG